MERLDRYLAKESSWSRSEVKKLIKAGRVSVNGKTDVRPEMKTDPDRDIILADGIRITPTGRVCIMMNKPAGVVSATRDGRDRTVIDLIQEPYAGDLFPVGRLDRDTEGLLLLTNDGSLSHALLSPKKHVPKTYFVILSGDPDEDIITHFEHGLEIGEKRRTLPAMLMFLSVDGDHLRGYGERTGGTLSPGQKKPAGMISEGQMSEFCLKSIALADYARCGENECCAAVCITEGKYHQIKRMFRACGREVRFLKRIAMSTLTLDPELETGAYRPLTQEELSLLE